MRWAALVEMWRGITAVFDTTAGLDIAALAVLVYLALVGLRHVRTAHALRGALVLGATYLLARQLSLALTAAALEAFLVVLMVVMVMVYRDELRRLVEQVSRLTRRRSTGSKMGETPRVVAEVAFELADQQCGALIVFAGDEALEPHVSGGIALGGEVSAPLLKSLFDASSAGHDGAAIIESNSVQRFSVHLPLSSNATVIGQRGTRHAAALGLSEACDALCVVVSEEQGAVSVAHGGALRPVEDADALAAMIRDHVGAPMLDRAGWRSVLTENNGLKFAALFIAAVSWVVLVYGGELTQRTLVARVVWHDTQEGLQLVRTAPAEVRIVVGGSRRDLALAKGAPPRVVLSAAELGRGEHRVRIAAEDIALPRGLTLRSVAPPEVSVVLEQPPAPASSASSAPARR